MLKDEFKVLGEEVIRRKVKKMGNSAHVSVPKDWIGEIVAVIRKGKEE